VWGGLVACVLLAGAARAAAGTYCLADIATSWKLCTEAHALLLAEDLDAAEPKINAAVQALPDWSAPHALRAVLYHWQSFQIRQNLRSGSADRLRRQALEEYEFVQKQIRRAVFTTPVKLYWIEAPQWLAPPRGLFGGTPPGILRALEAMTKPANSPTTWAETKLGLTGKRPLAADDAGTDLNPMPTSIRFNDSYYAKNGKLLEADETYYEALAAYLVNERRLMSAKKPMVPEATLGVMARVFSLWCVEVRSRNPKNNDTGGLMHKDLRKRFFRAFPDLMKDEEQLGYPVGEVLSLCGSRYGQYVLDTDNVEKAVYGFFKSPEHCECLLDRDNLFMGPAFGQVHHGGDFFLTINVIRTPRRLPATGLRSGEMSTAAR